MPEEIPPVHTTIEVNDKMPPDYKAEEALRAQGQKEAGWFGALWATLWASLADAASYLLTISAALLNKWLSLFGKVIASAQGEDNPEFYDLLATVIWDLTGVEVDPASFKNAIYGGGRLAGMDRIGAEIYNLLAQEFVAPDSVTGVGRQQTLFGKGIGGLPDYKLTPEQGIRASRRFLGFLMSFSVREGNMKMLSEFASWGMIDNYSGYAEELANNLSLGRLARHAFRPLVDTLIATPAEWAMNLQYRPKLLGESTAVRSWQRGKMTDAKLRDELALQGYSDERINAVIAANGLFLTDTDLTRLVNWGVWTRDAAIQHLKDRGYSTHLAEAILKANELAAAETWRRKRLDVLIQAYVDGKIDDGPMLDFLAGMKITDLEKRYAEEYAGTARTLPRRTLSLAQMNNAVRKAHATFEEWDEYLFKEGYADDDRLLLTLDLFEDMKDDKAKKATEEARKKLADAKAAKAAGTTPTV